MSTSHPKWLLTDLLLDSRAVQQDVKHNPKRPKSQNILNVLNIVSCSAFYEKEAMLMDPVDGPILASLLGIHRNLTKVE